MILMDGEHDGGMSLPRDIIFDVLARLLAKPLCRFRCVCKGWRDLISDPTFVTAQRSRAGPHLVGVFFGDGIWPPEVRVMDMGGNVVRVLEVRPLGKDDDGSVLQHQAPTRMNLTVYRKGMGTTAMIVDPAAGRACTLGSYAPTILSSFGLATPSGALKVIFIENLLSPICMVATIVDGGAELLRWRQTSDPPFDTSCFPEVINGVIYFLPHSICEYGAASSLGSHRIAAFNLEREEWKTIIGPPLGMQEDTWYFSLTKHKGTLGFLQCLDDHNGDGHYYAIIWLLIDTNKSVWVKEHTIQMPKTWELMKLLGNLDDGITLLLLVRETKGYTTHDPYNKLHTHFLELYEEHPRVILVFYNPIIKSFTKFVDIAMGSDDILAFYNGSLLS